MVPYQESPATKSALRETAEPLYQIFFKARAPVEMNRKIGDQWRQQVILTSQWRIAELAKSTIRHRQAHDRRKIVRFDVTEHPTAAWLSRQVTEAFPWDTTPRFLLRDRDSSYGPVFSRRVEAMGITEVVTAPRSPWQNPYVERAIGSIRRECLDQVIIFNERHLRRVLSSYGDYYHRTRTHLSLRKDCPGPRLVHPPTRGKLIAIPQVGGLHHRYERLAA